MLPERALVVFSGGQDSTTCLIKAIHDFGKDNVETITFSYGQRHDIELKKATWICNDLKIKQKIFDLTNLRELTSNALMDSSLTITQNNRQYPNTFVAGRNALFILYAGIYAFSHQISNLILGVSEADYSGYPDCRDQFVQSMNQTLNLAMDSSIKILTPLMYLSKAKIWALADQLGYLEYINEHTHTCYLGVEHGCGKCPSCLLRENGLKTYLESKN